MLTPVSLEQLVSRIEELLVRGEATVEWNQKVIDPDTGRFRQIDVVISRPNYRMMVECRAHAVAQDTQWIEELIGRRQSLRFDSVMAVSSSGFTRPAVDKAARFGVSLRVMEDLTDEEIAHWAKPLVASVTFLEIRDLLCDCWLTAENFRKISGAPKLNDGRTNVSPILLALNNMATQYGDRIATIDAWHHLECKLEGSRLFLGQLPVERTNLQVDLRPRIEHCPLHGVWTYTIPNDASATAVHAIRTSNNELEVIRAGSDASVIVDFTSVRPPPNCYLHTLNVDLGYVCKARTKPIVGPNLRLTSDNLRCVFRTHSMSPT